MSKAYLAAIASLLVIAMSSPAAAGTSPGRIEFEVLRDGRPFGRQSITVTENNGELTAHTNATLHAALGPVTVFRYSQRCRETWARGALTDLQCTTRQNGRTKTAQGGLVDGALRINGVSGAEVFDAGTLPTSWWTRPPTGAHVMINTETGARLPVRVTFIGRETIVANGVRIPADRIRVQGTLTVDLWYDDNDRWVNCAFTIQGQRMTYRLLTSPSEAPA